MNAVAKAQPTIAEQPFAAVKQVDAGVLNVGYAEAGAADGRAVVLLHGWPYDVHSYADVASLPAPSALIRRRFHASKDR